MAYTLIEPCCGSSALTLHLLGATRSLLPYQGNKWRFRHELTETLETLGFVGAPARVILTDPGPWGSVVRTVYSPALRQLVIARLRGFARKDPRQVYEELQGSEVSQEQTEFAAEFLFLQRLSFSGKAVGTKRGRWSSPGFNKSSAYGLAATDCFGAVKPMVPSLIRVLESYAKLRAADMHAERRAALFPSDVKVSELWGPSVVYIDPPYKGATAYPNGALDREDVVLLARCWAAAGAAVVVSEGAPIAELEWEATEIYGGRSDASPFRGKQQEWVTRIGAAV